MVNNTGINKPEWNPKDNTENVQGITKEAKYKKALEQLCFGENREHMISIAKDALESPFCQPEEDIHILREQLEVVAQQLQGAIQDYNDAKKEIERLKGLIEKLHTEAYGISPFKWQQFAAENKI